MGRRLVRSLAAPGNWDRLGVLLRRFRQHFILLLLRELEVLLAEEAEPRSLRPVLAAWVAAAHISLEAAGLPGNPVAPPRARCGQCGGHMFGEKLGEVVDENIERMRGASGHYVFMPNRTILRNYRSGPIPFSSASSISFRICSIWARSFDVGAQRMLSRR